MSVFVCPDMSHLLISTKGIPPPPMKISKFVRIIDGSPPKRPIFVSGAPPSKLELASFACTTDIACLYDFQLIISHKLGSLYSLSH